MGLCLRASLAAALATACGGPGDDETLDSACEPAQSVHEQALSDALDGAPACSVDADCVVMKDHAACEGIVELKGCDLSVHRRVLELYDPVEVSARMCEAAADAELGCTVSAQCVPHGAAVCRMGACVFAARE